MIQFEELDKALGLPPKPPSPNPSVGIWAPIRSTIAPPSADTCEIMHKLGRIPYKVDFDHTMADNAKYDEKELDAATGHHVPVSGTKYRTKVKTPAEGNVWSSHVYINDDWHLPVVDVDARSPYEDEVILHAFNTVAGCEVDHEWVPSSHAGHYHLYVNHLFHWDDYTQILLHLSREGIVEDGYACASIERGASFVRMPWIKKERIWTKPEPEPEYDPGVDDPDPPRKGYFEPGDLVRTVTFPHVPVRSYF